jgi:hypothetical protein
MNSNISKWTSAYYNDFSTELPFADYINQIKIFQPMHLIVPQKIGLHFVSMATIQS